MKKISILLGAALAAAALFLSGCATQHPDDKYLPVDKIWLIGNVTAWNFDNALEFETADKQTFTLELKADEKVMKAVKANSDKVVFKLLTNGKDWKNAWVDKPDEATPLTLDKETVLQQKDPANNIILTIEKDKTYIFTVTVKSQKEMTLTVKKE